MMPEFSAWLSGIKDGVTQRRLGRRLERAERGNLGDVKPVGEGVWGMLSLSGRAGVCTVYAALRVKLVAQPVHA